MTDNTIKVHQKLGQGKFSVYYVDCPAKNASYALKVFPKTETGTLHYHKEKVLARLDHPNIIQYIHIQCSYPDFNGLLTEYAGYGDLFEWMVNDMMSNEVLVRSYFHQLIEALEYLHGQNLAHLDIKLENLMIGEGFRLKIVDFDQSQSLKDSWLTSGGTKCYRAPEVLNGTCMDFAGADVYAAGVTLYVLMTKEFPFLEGEDGEVSLQEKSFWENKERFWAGKMRKQGRKGMISQEFVELINGMMERDAGKRWKIEDIKRSPWYNGEVLSYEGLQEEMSLRWEQKNFNDLARAMNEVENGTRVRNGTVNGKKQGRCLSKSKPSKSKGKKKNEMEIEE